MSQYPLSSEPETTADKILVAAAALFSEKGYARTTTREIAARAGVNEVTLFRTFQNKHNILEAIIQQHSALPDMLELMQSRFSGNLQADLTLLARTCHQAFLERASAVRLMLCESAQISELQNVMAEIPSQLMQTLANLLQGYIQRGEIHPLNPHLAAQAFFGFFFSLGVTSHMLEKSVIHQLSTDELIEQYVSLFLNGLQTGATHESH